MRRFAAVALPLAVIAVLAWWRAQGPEPRPASAPDNQFSAIRAKNAWEALIVDTVPHPIGTRANERVRSRLLTQLKALGYETRVQTRFACYVTDCGLVNNVLATRPGEPFRDAVVLAAHYDSVPAGPGASDDGMGVATLLEIARATRGEKFRNPIALLFTDGEEAGMLGAEAFVADRELSAGMGVVLNVESRGTYGPSNMFETSEGNRWLIRHMAGAVDRPQASSLYYTIYKLLPNDSDVSIFKREGKAAMNFASIRGINWYHTPYDDLAHMSAGTLQHHGDSVLGVTRAFGNADLAARSRSDATYFDLLNYRLVWWPQEWTLWIGVIGLVLLIYAARKSPPREMTFGVLTAFTALALAVLLGIGVKWLARLHSDGANWVAQPATSVAAMWLTGLGAALLAGALFHKRAKPLPMLYGIAIVWHMIGIALALTLPGAAYLFVVPATVVTICALAGANETVASAVSATVAAILFFPLGFALYDALGGSMMASIAVVLGAMFTLTAPVLGRMSDAAVALGLAIAFAIAALLQPPYDAARPQWISLTHVDDPAAQSPQWITGTLTPQLRSAAPFKPADGALTPWYGNAGYFATPAPRVAPRVVLEGQRNGDLLTLHVRSQRHANRVNLILHGNAEITRINGIPPSPKPGGYRDRMPAGWRLVVGNGIEEMTVECRAKGPIEAIGSDAVFGLPAAGATLAQARNATAIPVQDGDVSITRARGKW
jgi:hypothetical protein